MDSLLTTLLPALAAVTACVTASRSLIHFFQLESYQFGGYFRTLRRSLWQLILPGLELAVLGGALTVLALYLRSETVIWVQTALVAAAGLLEERRMRTVKAKKPLVFTARVKRLIAVYTVLTALCLVLPAVFAPRTVSLLLTAFWPALLPLWTACAGLVAAPIEKGISGLYFRDAQRMLKERTDLRKIGITGSYGKTSVKFILGTILQEKYQTLVPPSSFNTPMGLTRVIRTKLTASHQVFLAEMGARHVGDIRELCRLVHPQWGVLTSVGPQHLDTFHTIERIKSTKYELMDAVPEEGGVCFFPDDGAICRELYDRTAKTRRLCSLKAEPEADVWAEDIRVSSEGSAFRLCTKNGCIDCVTPLLGEHNIQNILLASMVALEAGLTLKQIARGIAKLQPVEHRLQLIANPGGMTIIDDAFNSNPSGAAKALEVLRQFGGRRIVITPGMVELGEHEEEFNREFGRKMAGCADLAILVGKKHVEPIFEGLKEAGFPQENILMCASLDEATARLRETGRAGDTVLFENDLPDHYSE